MARDEMEIDGLRIAFERAGRGPPVILLHGYVGDGRSTWQPQLESLCDEYAVVDWGRARRRPLLRSARVVPPRGLRRLPRRAHRGARHGVTAPRAARGSGP